MIFALGGRSSAAATGLLKAHAKNHKTLAMDFEFTLGLLSSGDAVLKHSCDCRVVVAHFS